MKATLTIEVPDDFEKGKCWKCPIKEVDTEYDCISCKAHSWVIHDAFDLDTNQVLTSDCPLEIQDECTINCEKRYTCKHCIQGMYCNSRTGNEPGTPCCCEPIGE